ncbi:hypothetical protein ACMFMG_012240 [Clarireedia jacksonii]
MRVKKEKGNNTKIPNNPFQSTPWPKSHRMSKGPAIRELLERHYDDSKANILPAVHPSVHLRCTFRAPKVSKQKYPPRVHPFLHPSKSYFLASLPYALCLILISSSYPPSISFPITPITPHHEKLTNFGSLGNPSSEIPSLLNVSCIHNRLASSKLTFFLRMIFWISFLPLSDRPERVSVLERKLSAREKLEEWRPDSMSVWNVEGTGW